MTKHEKTPLQRLMAVLLCVAMLAGFAVPAHAEEPLDNGAVMLTSDSEDQVVLSKAATLTEDGTYTINLEAFATGEVDEYVKPVDMVLVLDQSASMYTPMGLPKAINNKQYHDATKMDSSVVWYNNADFKNLFNANAVDSTNGLTFQEKIQQLGYFVAQSASGGSAYSGSNQCSHGDVDGDGTAGGIKIKNGSKSNADTGDCRAYRKKAANGQTVTGSCYFTHDWFVVQYVPGDAKPWKFYRVDDTTTPSTDPQTKGVDGVAVRTPMVLEYASIDEFATFTFYVTQYGALFDSITAFAQGLRDSNAAHRLAVTGFSNAMWSTLYRDGTGIYVNGNYTRYSPNYVNPDSPHSTSKEAPTGDDIYAVDQIPQSTYEAALVDVHTGYESIMNSLKAVKSDYYGTCQDAGFDMALKTLNYATKVEGDLEQVGREKIVVLFTDGMPSGTNNDSIVRKAAELKAAGYTVYTICTSTLDEDSIDFMRYSSSDYPNAIGYPDSEFQPDYPDKISKEQLIGEQIENPTYFKRVTNAKNMLEEFMSIVNDANTTVTLDEKAVMKDILADNFILPEGFDFNDIKLSVVDISTTDGVKFVEGDSVSYTYDEATGVYVSPDGKDTLVATYDKTTGQIDITGFDYAANFVTTESPGKKLVVSIEGIAITEGIKLDSVISTNNENSGLGTVVDGNFILMHKFPQPMTKAMAKTYVMDYADSIDIYPCAWFTEIKGIGTAPTIKEVTADGVTIDTEYGTFVGTVVDANHDGNTNANAHQHLDVRFTPKTMQWDEPAKMFVFGTYDQAAAIAEDDEPAITTGNYMWSQISVIPANNIYYEDDFATFEYDENGKKKETGLVGIEYTGTWENVVSGDGKVENTELPEENESTEGDDNGGVHGWVDSMTDDTGYSEGSAHKADVSGDNSATATFTFSGKGVDIYSRTNDKTGTIYATLKGEGNGVSVNKGLIVDTVSESDDYYQIPTLSFTGLEYGTYTVTIRVTAAAAEEERFIYYLDGIRVYNPIKEDSEVVQGAYGDKEVNAVFTEVRDILKSEGSLGDGALDAEGQEIEGAVFIDKSKDDKVGFELAKYDETEFGVYGPENEVYLAPGQAIAFKVPVATEYPEEYYYVGLKSPTGNSVSVSYSNQVDGQPAQTSLNLNHTTDMYYEIAPLAGQGDAAGIIYIKNTTEVKEGTLERNDKYLLSVTKLRTTGDGVNPIGPELLPITAEEAVSTVYTAEDLPSVDFDSDDIITEDSVNPDTPAAPQEPETPTEPEVPEVEIINPQPNTKPNFNFNQSSVNKDHLNSMVSNLFKNLLGWFRR